MRSCDCGEKRAGTPESTGAGASAVAVQAPLAAGGAANAPSAASGPGRTLDRISFTPAPDSKLTRSLIAARDEIDKGKTYDKLSEPTSVAAVLGDKLGALSARGEVSSAYRTGSGTQIAAAARNYIAGKQTVRVKIIDTAFSPNARRAVSERLAEIGNEAAGNQRGVFVRGNPAVVAHFAQEHTSRASALIANRFLVQVMVNEAAQPDAALKVIEQLDWAKLAPKSVKVQAKP
ncbi:MAG TPA: hypothetical protein VK509_20105 [Polyangiales bacterium]|nr:hypothetical protein [Polyangiales bacterium]